LCRWADAEGLKRIGERLEHLAQRYGSRFEPAPYLLDRPAFYA
jgi:hypothetical protein